MFEAKILSLPMSLRKQCLFLSQQGISKHLHYFNNEFNDINRYFDQYFFKKTFIIC